MNRYSPPRAPARKAAAVAASLLCSFGAQAQSTPSEPEQPAQAAPLTRVVVTANKREQAAIDVPASVSTVSAERLALSGNTRLEDYVAQVPGLALTAATRGQTVVTLRGIGTGAAQAMPTTGQYIDDAPIGSINAFAAGSKITPDLDPYDLRRVEVLKGPQGTQYGAGAVGGLVRYVTEPANARRFGGVVSAGASAIDGGGDGHNLRAALNIPLVADVLGLRVSGFKRKEGGYIDNPVTGQSEVNEARVEGGRVALDWKIAPDWSLRAWAMSQTFTSDGLGQEDVHYPSLAPLNGPLERITYVAETQDISLDIANVALRGTVGAFDLVSSTTYQKSRLRRVNDSTVGSTSLLQAMTGLPGLGAYSDTRINTDRKSQELRARSSAFDERLEYEFGVFWTKETNLLDSQLPAPFFYANGATLPVPPLGDGQIGSTYEERSVFANASYALTPAWTVLAGVRRAKDEQHVDLDYKRSALSPQPVKLVQDQEHSKTTWMLGTNYKLHPDTAVYGRAATGYRPGGPSALPPGVLDDGKVSFAPDELTSYELGFKSAFLEGKASVEAALFSTNWKNVQLMANAPARPPLTYIGLNYGTNGGSARSKGAEATFLLSPSANLSLRANAAYTHTYLTSPALAVGGIEGDAMPYIPKWSGSLGAEYRFLLGSLKSWIGGSISRTGKRTSDYSLEYPVELPGYNMLTVNGGLDWGNIRLSLYGKNLSNARGINFAGSIGATTPANPAGAPYAAAVIQPRTFGFDLSYRF